MPISNPTLKPGKNGDGFTSARRVRRRSEFERAYKSGTRVHGRFMTVFLTPNGLSLTRLGIAATRKLGSAVQRNRAKRLAREIFRRHATATGLDVIIVPRREMLDAPFINLEADFLAALERNSAGRSSRARRRGVDRSRRDSRL